MLTHGHKARAKARRPCTRKSVCCLFFVDVCSLNSPMCRLAKHVHGRDCAEDSGANHASRGTSRLGATSSGHTCATHTFCQPWARHREAFEGACSQREDQIVGQPARGHRVLVRPHVRLIPSVHVDVEVNLTAIPSRMARRMCTKSCSVSVLLRCS